MCMSRSRCDLKDARFGGSCELPIPRFFPWVEKPAENRKGSNKTVNIENYEVVAAANMADKNRLAFQLARESAALRAHLVEPSRSTNPLLSWFGRRSPSTATS
jgi:cell division FtsZ-interacting protein ZapD